VNITVDSKSETKTKLSATLKRIEELEEKLINKDSDEELQDKVMMKIVMIVI